MAFELFGICKVHINRVHRYLNSSLFEAYSHTRMKTYDESGGSLLHGRAENEGFTVHTEGGHQIEAKNMIMATNAPLSKYFSC